MGVSCRWIFMSHFQNTDILKFDIINFFFFYKFTRLTILKRLLKTIRLFCLCLYIRNVEFYYDSDSRKNMINKID